MADKREHCEPGSYTAELTGDIERAMAQGDIPLALSLSLGERYEITDLLGQGGMGMVFKATAAGTEKVVAIKAMLLDHENPDRRMRFWREVRAMQAVRHENVVALYDHGPENAPLPYLVLEFIEGTTLWSVLNVKLMSEEVALCVLHELALALSAVHQSLLVHRDLKPENIFVTEAGRVVLGDFGIVRGALGASDTFVRTKTSALGTPHYASPEHLLSPNLVGPPADVFSLGCLLHAMFTGESPFAAATVTASLQRVGMGQRTPAPNHLGAEVRNLLDLLLQRNPESRPPNGEAVLALVQPMLHSRGITDCRERFSAFLRGEADEPTTLYTLARATHVDRQKASGHGVSLAKTRVGRVPAAPLSAMPTQALTRVAALPTANPPALASGTSSVPTNGAVEGATNSAKTKRSRAKVAAALSILVGAVLAGAWWVSATQTTGTIVDQQPSPAANPAQELPPPAPPPSASAAPPPQATPGQPPAKSDRTEGGTAEQAAPRLRPRAATDKAPQPPPKPATVVFITKPWAKVTVDGAVLGTTPIFHTTELSPGLHSFRFEHPTHHTQEMKLSLSAGETREIKIELTKNP